MGMFKIKEGALVNCTCNVPTDTPITSDDFSFTITPDAGYVLEGMIHYYNDPFTDGQKITEENENGATIYPCNGLGSYTIIVEGARAIKKPRRLTPNTHLYVLDDSSLSGLSKSEFVGDQGRLGDMVSPSIIALYKTPLPLPKDLIGSIASIKVGKYITHDAPVLMDYEYIYDFGSINIKEKYNDVYDYKNTECILHLPFTEATPIKVDYVINQIIQIKLHVDFYSGKGRYIIKSSFTNNETVLYIDVEIGNTIPYFSNIDNKHSNELNYTINNDIKQSYIEVVRNIPYTSKDKLKALGKRVEAYGVLGEYTGYIEADHVVLNIDATNEEKDEITSLLSSGIFIKPIDTKV